MKRLLMIAYDFPPMLPGVRRTVAFVRYLREFGWEPVVLTVKPVRTWGYDTAPLEEFANEGIQIHRCGSTDPHRLSYVIGQLRQRDSPKQTETKVPSSKNPKPRVGGMGARFMKYLRQNHFCPDDRVGWVKPAIKMATRILAGQHFDAIWTTSYPHSTHLIGLAIKRQHPQIPWLADFRDGWTQNADFFATLSPRLQKKSSALEREVAFSCDAITAVSPPIADYFRQLTRAQTKTVVTLPNGFDERDIASAVPRQWPGFSVLYSGTLFGDRTAESLFAAASEAIARHANLRENLKLVFVGAFDQRLKTLAQKFALEDHLILSGPLSYQESLGAQKGADVLVALVAETPNVEIMLTQKIFEYLGCRKPVLALAPERSALANLVSELKAGIICNPDSAEEGARALIALYEQITAGRWNPVASESLAPYTRREQTRELGELLDALAASQVRK